LLAASLCSVERKQVLEQVSRLGDSSVCVCVCPKSVLWQNCRLDPDAVWGGEWGRSRDGCIRSGWRRGFSQITLGFLVHNRAGVCAYGRYTSRMLDKMNTHTQRHSNQPRIRSIVGSTKPSTAPSYIRVSG